MMKMPRLDGQPVNLFPTRAGLLATLSGVCLALLWAATTLLPIHMPPFYFWLQDVLAAVFGLGVLAPLLHSQTLRQRAHRKRCVPRNILQQARRRLRTPRRLRSTPTG